MNACRIAGVLCLIGIEALLYGYSYPFFSLALERRELATWLIGLNASLAGAGILIVGPLLPGLLARFGVHRLVAGLFATSFLSFSALLVTDDLVVWFVARFVMGACFAALWTASEIWLNGVVGDRHRGRIVGASGMLYAICQFLGPLTLGEVGVTGSLPLFVAMAPLAIGVLIALSIQPATATGDEEEGLATPRSLGLALTVAGGFLAAAFLGGVGQMAMKSLLPLYGLAHGLDDAGAARLVAVFILGEAALVAGLGWTVARHGRRLTLKICVLAATLSALAIPLAAGIVPLLWPVLFVAGGTVAGIHTLGIVVIGHDFRGHKLAVVSAGFATAYSAGSVVGPASVGFLIDLLGPEALPLSVAIGFVGLSTYLFMSDDGAERARHEPHPVVPNLKYLEDSQFEEEEEDASPAALPPEAETGTKTASPDSTLFRTPRSARSPFGSARPRSDLDSPLDDLEERFKRRSAEIAQLVAKRQKSREAWQAGTPPARRPQSEDDA